MCANVTRSTKKSRPPNIIINYCHDNVTRRNYLRYTTRAEKRGGGGGGEKKKERARFVS